ncbi:Predicted transcriptional regulator [Anaerosphaera aminiphila DSM 21120]|uniref:Predicted transcriptional regulator n=1 Tax=Anaerosphaera aminiphila DSM 21120 TaxID=1120995 RepID=A0A1M5PM29_9FIRM|nr:Predicted transcriptional regulator [Anaerosphaera aminiphila DSM 21120]
MEEKRFQLSDNESQILNTLWKEDRALTRAEIIEFTENKTWKASSIHILLNQLLGKGAIVVEGYVQSGKNYGRTYKASLNKDEYDAMIFKSDYLKLSPSKAALNDFFKFLISVNKIDESTIKNIKSMLKEQEKNN